MKQDSKLRRSGAVIMANLVLLLGSLAYIMLLAVINGSVGFLCAMGVTLCGAVGVAKALGESIALSYGTIIALAIGCGVLRGILRFLSSTATTTLHSGCWRCCAIKSSAHCARSAPQSWRASKRVRSSP